MIKEEAENNSIILNYRYPSLEEYYAHLTPFITLSVFIAVFVFILNLAIFLTTISKASNRLTNNLLLPTTILCSLYIFISLAAVTTILIPQSWLPCHTVMHLSFPLGAVIFQNLCFRYVNSETKFLKEVDGNEEAMDIQTPPCCCCCLCLPKMSATLSKLYFIKFLVWQMPLVQTSIMIILNVIYFTDVMLYDSVLLYLIPGIVVSIVLGLWGLNITVRMINKLIPDYNLTKKMLSLQLILMLCKLQYLILDKQLSIVEFNGIYPITNNIYKHTILNLLIIVEMTLVSILVQNAYSLPVEL